MTKPKLSVKISSIANPSISKIFTKANGLRKVTIEGIKNQLPFYGIISRSGNLDIIDSEGWLKQLSDSNIMPDISIDVYVDDILHYTFISASDISYLKLTKQVKINLIDAIDSLQDKNIDFNMVFTDETLYSVFIQICSNIGIECFVDKDTTDYLGGIKVDTLFIEKGKAWNILQEFVYGARCIMYRKGSSYVLKKVVE